MAELADLQVFNDELYSATTEILQQQIDLFNEATRGAIVLRSAAHQGDFSELAYFKKVTNVVRRRDAYADGTEADLTVQKLEHLLDVSVKVAAGTYPIAIPPSQFLWIRQNPELAAAAYAQQPAVDMFADMLNTALQAGSVAFQNTTHTVSPLTDKSGEATPTATLPYLIDASRVFGDRANRIVCWVMHSKVDFDLHEYALANAAGLFSWANVNVMTDSRGRVFVITDSPSLTYTDPAVHYRTLGLVPGGLYVGQNPDFVDNWEAKNLKENIQRTYQAEWSFNLGVEGYAWDKTTGGANPDATDLATVDNWDPIATDIKNTAGVMLVTL